MTKVRIPKKIAGVRIPRKLRRAGARLPKTAMPVAALAMASAVIAGVLAGMRGMRRGFPFASGTPPISGNAGAWRSGAHRNADA
jgi:hypothetical protein